MHRTLFNAMLMLSEKDVKKCLSLKDCLDVNRKALMAVAEGTAQVPTRLGLSYQNKEAQTEDAKDWTLFKPASFSDSNETLMGIKLVSIRAMNPQQGLPTVPATVLSLNAETGYVDAVLASTYLTAARTAAGSALSCELVRPNLQRLVVFGAGLQAELHIQLISTAIGRPIPHTTIINRSEPRALQLKESISSQYTQQIDIVLLHDQLGVADALSKADVVVTATNTVTPLFDGSFLPSGCHIAGVGSYTPDMAEVPARTVDRCRVMIDTPEARQVGDLKNLSQQHPVELLGNLLKDKSWLEETSEMLDLTFYKSVGTAIQDVLTANIVVQRAREQGVGTEVDMS